MGLYCDIIKLKDEELDVCLEISKDQDKLYSLLQNKGNEDYFEFDKTWHGIHYVLSNYSCDPASSFILKGGTAIQEIDWSDSYGVDVVDMRGFRSQEVYDINSVILKLTDKKFPDFYRPREMNILEIYPRIWEKTVLSRTIVKITRHSTALNYLTYYYRKLGDFINRAEEKNQAIVIKYHE